MTPDEHQRERRALWCAAYIEAKGFAEDRALIADNCVIEFDKRFPAPAAVEPEPRITIEWPACGDAELAALREKARLWDALESARVRITHQFDGTWTVDHDAMPVAPRYETLREAVQAAIDAGALK